ncbi:MAG: gamma carbonic anhydrase family protein [Nitrospinota bacterium]|nr:MAG: gamma carbonic anhydrase family protein [Nitrospinota bacterium]
MIREFNGIRPKIHETAFIAETAMVIGEVEIGEESSVWFNTIIRGDVGLIRIGNRVNIQDGCLLHNNTGGPYLILEDEVSLGHCVVAHGCTLKRRSLIGIGAIVLDGAVVGEESIVAAGTLVPPGMEIPPRTLVMGSPAKVRREITERDYELIRRTYTEYAKRGQVYKRLGFERGQEG